MNNILATANLLIRNERPLDNPKVLINTFHRQNFLQITFQTCGCQYSETGSCTMCNYGKGRNADSQIILEELEKICLSKDFTDAERILLGASGSFLDENEIPKELQFNIMKRIAQSSIKEVFIETHYKSVTEEKLRQICNIFPNICVNIEMGLETVNQEYQINILNKNISLTQLRNTISLIHEYGMEVSLNVLLGMPFFNEYEQIIDTQKSIYWALENGADYVVIFPINIQPYTIFEWWYMHDYMTIPSPWMIVKLLSTLSDEQLKAICLAWYGNRRIVYSPQKSTIIPYACPNCQAQLLTFFEEFATNFDIKYRKEKLNQICHTTISCECRKKAFLISENCNISPNSSKWEDAYVALERWVNNHAIS